MVDHGLASSELFWYMWLNGVCLSEEQFSLLMTGKNHTGFFHYRYDWVKQETRSLIREYWRLLWNHICFLFPLRQPHLTLKDEPILINFLSHEHILPWYPVLLLFDSYRNSNFNYSVYGIKIIFIQPFLPHLRISHSFPSPLFSLVTSKFHIWMLTELD